jgi:hypothetical protein
MPDSGTCRWEPPRRAAGPCRLSVAPKTRGGSKPPYLMHPPLLQSSNEGSDVGRTGRSGPQTARAGSPGFMNPRTGRLMRQSEGKTVVQVYDYADTRVPVLKRMFEKRMKTYRALGFLEKESGRA